MRVRAAVHGRAGYPAPMLAAPIKLAPGAPAMLRIRFADGERPHLFWVSDGRSARGDAGTQVMAGMVGAAVHPNPRAALVIGLGTGSTAGW